MHITNVLIPKEVSNNGLETIKMDKIDRVVLIAGKNGSGKSRLLNTLKTQLSLKPTASGLEQARKNIIQYEERIKQPKNAISANYNNIVTQPTSTQISSWKNNMDNAEREVKNLENALLQNNNIIDWNLITTSILSEKYTSVDFVPKSLGLIDWKTLTQNDIEMSARGMDQIGMGNLMKGTLSYIQILQNKWFNATHQHTTVLPQDKANATNRYNSFCRLVESFLNTKIDRNNDGSALVFGFELGKANLSSGQTVLLQLCVAIHAQNASLNDLIIFMDEPENHLHPSAVIEIIKKIEENVPNGQLWIATHSIPLLAHFDPKYLWFMDNNKINYKGREPEIVLNSLLGDDEQREKLHNFMNLPSIYAFNRFAHECLFDPAVLMTGSKDPQISQIRSMLNKLPVSPIKILDFGAGKGRLLANVIESLGMDKSKFIEKYEYIAFDEYSADKVDCQSYISSIYEDAKGRYYNSVDQLFTEHDKGSFHVVVMCNVLHEIPVENWRDYFGERGHISQCLNDNGFLLLVEDTEMPVGEKAHQKGFLVIDTPEIKDLFSIDSTRDTSFVFDDFENKGRLKAHLIPKSCLTRMTPQTLKKAVENLRDKAGRRILDIRKEDKSFRNGLKHGYWVQIYANAQLALAVL